MCLVMLVMLETGTLVLVIRLPVQCYNTDFVSDNSGGKFCSRLSSLPRAEGAWKFSACLGKGMPEGEVQGDGHSSQLSSFTSNCWCAAELC